MHFNWFFCYSLFSICMCMCMGTWVYCVSVCACVCMHACACARAHGCVCVCVCMCVCMCLCVCVYACMCVHVYVCRPKVDVGYLSRFLSVTGFISSSPSSSYWNEFGICPASTPPSLTDKEVLHSASSVLFITPKILACCLSVWHNYIFIQPLER